MSVIVKFPDSSIRLICKGADATIKERLNMSQANLELFEVTNKFLEEYAKNGLRTLLIADKVIP